MYVTMLSSKLSSQLREERMCDFFDFAIIATYSASTGRHILSKLSPCSSSNFRLLATLSLLSLFIEVCNVHHWFLLFIYFLHAIVWGINGVICYASPVLHGSFCVAFLKK